MISNTILLWRFCVRPVGLLFYILQDLFWRLANNLLVNQMSSKAASGNGDASLETMLDESIAANKDLNTRFNEASTSFATRESTMASQLAEFKQVQEDVNS